MMMFNRNKNSEAGSSPPSGGRVPTHWDPSSDATTLKFMKNAKVAGKKGVPDPSMSQVAPSCFYARHAVAQDQLHQEYNELLAEIEPFRTVMASMGNLDAYMDSGALSEAQERRLAQYLEVREQLVSRVQRSEARMRSIMAVHDRVVADMKEVYRKYYPFADHFDVLVFPELNLKDLRYGGGDAPDLGALMPPQPMSSSASSNPMLERKGEYA